MASSQAGRLKGYNFYTLNSKTKCIPNHSLKNRKGLRTPNRLKRQNFLHTSGSIKPQLQLEEIQTEIKKPADDAPP